MILEESHDHAIEEENYFVSMTDMMVGLIFIFIIMLMYFALQFQQVTEELAGANSTRTEILEELQSSLKEKGVTVDIDVQNGVLRLPDSILFDSGQSQIKPSGVSAVASLAAALSEVLPCYTDSLADGVRPVDCPQSDHRIESVYIEGHTDADAFAGAGALRDNWDLSVARATNTYRAVVASQAALTRLCARKEVQGCEPILSVSGYGEQRPIDRAGTDAAKRANRRIDLRIIMITPDSGQTAAAVDEALRRQ